MKDKYRAWDRQEEEFIYDGVDGANEYLVTHHGIFWSPYDSTSPNWERFSYNRFEIEKLRGKDKNGRELYENDIIKIVYPDNKIDNKIKIVDDMMIQGIFALNKVTKLGNIHQNKDILNNKQEEK